MHARTSVLSWQVPDRQTLAPANSNLGYHRRKCIRMGGPYRATGKTRDLETGFVRSFLQLKEELTSLLKALLVFQEAVVGKHVQILSDNGVSQPPRVYQVETSHRESTQPSLLGKVHLLFLTAVHIKIKSNTLVDLLSRRQLDVTE